MQIISIFRKEIIEIKENEIDAKSLTISHRQILSQSLSKRLDNT